MDEIASKYYVNLSRCEKGHDSCTEYSSMLHDMVHGHMLYDTVDFVLYQKDVPEIDLLSEVSPYLTNKTKSRYSEDTAAVASRFPALS